MEPLVLRVSSTTVEAIIVGIALGAALVLIRKIQLALGVKDDREEKQAHIRSAQ